MSDIVHAIGVTPVEFSAIYATVKKGTDQPVRLSYGEVKIPRGHTLVAVAYTVDRALARRVAKRAMEILDAADLRIRDHDGRKDRFAVNAEWIKKVIPVAAQSPTRIPLYSQSQVDSLAISSRDLVEKQVDRLTIAAMRSDTIPRGGRGMRL